MRQNDGETNILGNEGDLMKPAIAILLALTLVVFSGCSSKPNDAMVVCGTYAVPGFVVREMKGGTYTCKELERDTNGRLLYEFSTKRAISQYQRTKWQDAYR